MTNEIPETGPDDGLDTSLPAADAVSHPDPDLPVETATLSANESERRVYDLALTLFDCTRTLHNLGDNARLVLAEAAGLVRQPIPHAKKKPHKAIFAWLQTQANPALSEDDRSVLAAVVAYLQGRLKRKEITNLDDLSPAEVQQALILAALLRIAASLDGSSEGGVILDSVNLTDESIWLVIDGAQAEAAAAAVGEATRSWTQLGFPEMEVLETHEAAIRLLPLPEQTESIGLTAGDGLAEAGRKALRFQFARMLGQEAGTRQGDDIEALHHMRVATRRLRAAFDVFEVAFEKGAIKPYRNGLRQAGRALGKVRDLDVLIDKARKYAAGMPEDRQKGMDPLLEVWAAQREAARMEMLAYLDSKEYADFKRKFNIFVNTPGAGARPIPAGEPVPYTVRDLAPALIYERLAAVRAYAPLLADAPVERLHALRIEFKKLRYTVEYFQEALGRRSKIVLDLCKELQDHLGDLNDSEVASHLLRQFIDDWEAGQDSLPIHARRHIGEVVNYLAYNHGERHRLMSSFQKVWHKRFEHAAFRRSLGQAVSVL